MNRCRSCCNRRVEAHSKMTNYKQLIVWHLSMWTKSWIKKVVIWLILLESSWWRTTSMKWWIRIISREWISINNNPHRYVTNCWLNSSTSSNSPFWRMLRVSRRPYCVRSTQSMVVFSSNSLRMPRGWINVHSLEWFI